MSKFPKRLKALRQKKSVSQTELSKQLHYGYTAVANYEGGRNEPSFDVLIKIADYFGVTIDYLLGREDYSVRFDSMAAEERELVENYRMLDEEVKIHICDMVRSIAENKK